MMEDNGNRRHFPPERKFEIVKEAIMGKSPISEVCKKYGIDTGQYYKWQQVFFNGAIEGLTNHKQRRKESSKEERLNTEIRKLKDIIAEIASENLQLKKNLGE